MKNNIHITRIHIYRAEIPFKEPFEIALGLLEKAQFHFIRIHTSEGIYGTGQTAPFHAVTGETRGICDAAAVDLAGLLVGRNPLDIAGNLGIMNRFLAFNPAVKSGFDLALHDIAGKVSGLPLYALLGGDRRELVTDYTIGMNTPKRMADDALALKNKGFSAIKVKLGQGFESDLARIKKIRECIGSGIQIRVDANQGWDYPTAVTILPQMAPYGIEYCEQPLAVWDHENMRRLREKSVVPIAADESVFDDKDAFKLAAKGCCDILNIKLAKSGGIHTAVKIDNIAASAGLPCMIGCMAETRLSLTAAAHLACAHPNIKYLDLDGDDDLTVDPIEGGMTLTGEKISVPDSPGIGADVNSEFLEQCESKTVTPP